RWGEIPHRDRPIPQRHVRNIQAAGRPGSLPSPLHEPLHADPSAAQRARGGARGPGQGQSVLGSQGSAGAPSTHRSHARQALWLPGASGCGGAPLSAERYLARRALRARDLGLSLLRSASRGGADRRPHPGPTAKPLFLRAQGTGPAGSGQAGRGNRSAAPRDSDRAEPGADPDHARAGARRHARSGARRRGDIALAGCGAPRARVARGLWPAGDGLWAEERPGPCGSRFRPGCLYARRHQDGARNCHARQNALSGRVARLGQGRRPCQPQAPAKRLAASMTEGQATMKFDSRPFAAALLAVVLALPAAALAQAQSFSSDQRREIERIVKDYLLANPDLLQDVMSELEKRQATAEAEKHRASVKEHSAALFTSPRQVTLGNPQGDVTVVAFFDYNCSYCKRAMSDMLELLKTDGKLKFVLKEFPVLGEGSIQAAQVAAAVRMQDKSGKKYLEFHQKLLGGRGQADRTRALAAAKDAGLDMARI